MPGPVLVGFGEDAGSLPRGPHIVDGVRTTDIGTDGQKTLTMAHGTTDDLCDRID